ncbi:TPA: LPXTG cell wall anchor domain-containing protein [Enterococcus faecalis]|nr:LPXTG cell wall anchor domain-containing protein [Enterococcus faecalis]
MKGEKKKLKKYLLISLFSTLFLTSGVIAFAEEETPTSPSVTEETEVSVSVPATEEVQPTVPTVPETSEPEVPVPTTPEEPEVPVTPSTEGSEETETPATVPTEPSTTPEQPGTTDSSEGTTGSSSTDQPTTPSTSEEPKEEPKEEPSQPAEKPKEDKETKPKEDKPAAPAKEVTVSVTPAGEITTDSSKGTSVPIVTSDVKELTHIPTPTMPLKTASGQTIVGVKDGVPLVQDSQGNLVEDQSIPVKKLPSGNIEVKTADGKTKVLPKTGEEIHAALSILGVIVTSIAGFFGFKRKKKIIGNVK